MFICVISRIGWFIGRKWKNDSLWVDKLGNNSSFMDFYSRFDWFKVAFRCNRYRSTLHKLKNCSYKLLNFCVEADFALPLFPLLHFFFLILLLETFPDFHLKENIIIAWFTEWLKFLVNMQHLPSVYQLRASSFPIYLFVTENVI